MLVFKAGIFSALYSAAAVAALLIFGGGGWRVAAFALSQFVAAAVLIPFFLASSFRNARAAAAPGARTENFPPRTDVRAAGFRGALDGICTGLLSAGCFLLVSLMATFAAEVLFGPVDLGLLASVHVLLAAYALFCAGLFVFFQPLTGALGAEVATTTLLLVLTAGPFWLNGFLAIAAAGARAWILFAALVFNPVTAAGFSIFHFDVLRMKGPIPIYDISNMSDYCFVYPAFSEALEYWVAAGAAFGAAGLLVVFVRTRFSTAGFGKKSHDEIQNAA
jgi:hypothetical protein